jgi:hypothetical protein
MEYLKNHPEIIDFPTLSSNHSDRALDILEQNPEKINLTNISGNKNPRAQIIADFLNIQYRPQYVKDYFLRNDKCIFQAYSRAYKEEKTDDNIADVNYDISKTEITNLIQNPVNIDWFVFCGNKAIQRIDIFEKV